MLAQAVFKDGEKEYPLTPPNLGTETLYTQFLERAAIAGVTRHKEAWGADYLAVYERVAFKVGLNLYEWGGQLWAESLRSLSDAKELAFLCLKQESPGLSRDTFAKLWAQETYQKPEGKANRIDDALFATLNRPNSSGPDTAGSA